MLGDQEGIAGEHNAQEMVPTNDLFRESTTGTHSAKRFDTSRLLEPPTRRAARERLGLELELELFECRPFIAKAERADNEQQLWLEFEQKLKQLDELARTLETATNRRKHSQGRIAITLSVAVTAHAGRWRSDQV